jgi:beta-lactamase regulating signal transducer with metallopeptidase domain
METLSESAATFIANALWQISVLLMIAVVCARLILRTPSARRQYLFWVAVFILSVGLPAFSLCSFRDNSKFVVRIPFENNRANIEKTGSIFDTTENAFSIQSNQRIGAFDISIVLSIVSICYFSFLAYRLFYLLKIWRRTALLRHSIKNEKLPSMMDAVAERCCVALEMDTVPIFFSDKIASPITLGARKPIIILPESFISITSEKTLSAVLGHELAHIRRRDYGWNRRCCINRLRKQVAGRIFLR